MNQKNLKKFSARYLLSFTTDQLWNCLIGDFIILFEDGVEIETNYKETLFSSYTWDLIRKYPKTAITSKHHIQSFIKNKTLTSRSNIDLLGSVYWDVSDTHNFYTPVLRNDITKMVYEITNNIYNDLQERCERYVASIDILDFIGIIEHPDIKQVLDNPTRDKEYIDNCYSTILSTMSKSKDLDQNGLVKAHRHNLVNQQQVLQCIGPRGIVTEVDSLILPIPITRSYTQGMRYVYDTIAESRTAAKALYFSDSQLKDAEYFARRLQLLTMYVERLHYEDCGSTTYVNWSIKPPIIENGKIIHKGDLENLDGKYYLDPETNTLKILSNRDKHLYNKNVKIRSVLTCKHPDKKGICSVCFGRMSDNVMLEANLGHVSAATMTEQTTQSVLSIKHVDFHNIAETIYLNEINSEFFRTSKDGISYLLNPAFQSKDIQMIVGPETVFGLIDIDAFDNLKDINPVRISRINYLSLSRPNKPTVVLNLLNKNRAPFLSLEFLKYIKEKRWSINESGGFIFDLSEWDCSLPIMKLQRMEYNYTHNSYQIADLIESRVEELTERANPESPIATLTELFDLVNSKLSCNIALLEVIIYGAMVKDVLNNNYGMARFSDKASLGVADMIIKNRSCSNSYAYEEQSTSISSPTNFFKMNRPDSIFDVFICPNEVITHKKSKNI